MARKPRVGSIYKRGNVLWLKYYRNGQVFRESARTSDYNEAERLLKRRAGEIVTNHFAGLGPERIRVCTLLEDLIADYRLRDRKSVRMSEQRIRKHLMPAFGDSRAADLGTRHVKAYVLRRRKDGAANATINRELELLHRAFKLAYESEPPLVARVPRIEPLPEDNVRTGRLDHVSYLQLRDLLAPPYRLLLVIGYHTGARLGELLSIRWEQVHFREAEIRLDARQTKTRKARVLPIYGEMLHWLTMAKAEHDVSNSTCPWVFVAAGRRMVYNWRTWRNYCALAGVPALRFHDLRRTALTNMIAAGIPEKVAMEISGHRTRKTFERYHIVSDRNIREVASKMETFFEATGTISGTVEAAVNRKRLN